MSVCPGKAEQVELELLKARLSLGRAGTEPPDHPPQLETYPSGMKPLVPGCAVLQPQHKHQTLDPNHCIGESICTHASQTGESPKPNSAESVQPHHLTSNSPRDEQSVSAGGRLCKQKAARSALPEPEQNRRRVQRIKNN